MPHEGPTAAADGGADDTELAVFVERMAAAGSDAPTARAEETILGALAHGDTPPGVRRLAEALAASLAARPSPPRCPVEDPATVVAAVRGSSLVVLEDDGGVAESVAALLADGRRVVVAAETAAELDRLRRALPEEVADRVLDDLPGLAPAQVREVRRLLATSTAARRARRTQRLPDAALMPDPGDVAQLCAHAAQLTGPAPAVGVIATVMTGLDTSRVDAVTSVARLVQRALAAMPPADTSPWAWDLLGELIYGRQRPAFDQLRADTAQATAALDWARPAPSVVVSGPLPPDARGALLRYAEFLGSGARSLRRHAAQREVLPALRMVRVGGRAPESVADIRRIVEHLELGERLAAIDHGCRALGIAAPRDEAGIGVLADGLDRIATAARSVGALRHDVLFLAEGSPLSVPDVAAAGRVAGAILDFAEYGSVMESARRLEDLGDAVLDMVPAGARAPEHEAAARALRQRESGAYDRALESFGAARREARHEQRQADLLDQLAAHCPRLAESWAELARTEPAALGFACLRTAGALLSALPPPDSADVVVVLGAHRLGVERLLLTAAAPRLVAVVPAGTRPSSAPAMLSVLRRASAVVVRGRSAVPAARSVTDGAAARVRAASVPFVADGDRIERANLRGWVMR